MGRMSIHKIISIHKKGLVNWNNLNRPDLNYFNYFHYFNYFVNSNRWDCWLGKKPTDLNSQNYFNSQGGLVNWKNWNPVVSCAEATKPQDLNNQNNWNNWNNSNGSDFNSQNYFNSQKGLVNWNNWNRPDLNYFNYFHYFNYFVNSNRWGLSIGKKTHRFEFTKLFQFTKGPCELK